MAEGTYEYECMRAELLGVEKPDYDEFLRRKREEEAQKVEEEAHIVEEDEIDTENLKEVENQHESLKKSSGGLEELNSILSITQKKIDGFKVRCGSITDLLKSKVGSIVSGSDASNTNHKEANTAEAKTVSHTFEEEEEIPSNAARNGNHQKKSDLSKALDNHTDKLDSMLESAERAHNSMHHQNKQLKKLLK